jgi:hypothetical protein
LTITFLPDVTLQSFQSSLQIAVLRRDVSFMYLKQFFLVPIFNDIYFLMKILLSGNGSFGTRLNIELILQAAKDAEEKTEGVVAIPASDSRYIKLTSLLNTAICTTISYTLI